LWAASLIQAGELLLDNRNIWCAVFALRKYQILLSTGIQ
jgi:hypothetical protein